MRTLFYSRSSLISRLALAALLPIAIRAAHAAPAQDPLPSWNDGTVKQAIVDFARRVTDDGSPDHVPTAERIAVFDNDGTLWPEYPLPFQAAFTVDRLRQRAAVEDWLATAKHPRFERPYDQLTYRPMQEVLVFLRAHGFKTWIVSGGGADFMRVWSERVYGIPPEQIVGSTARTRFEMRADGPMLVKTLEHLFVDDKAGKPVGIHQFIGRRPIACFGNSDGDLAMLHYTTVGNPRPTLGVIIHHTDADREYAYDAKPTGTGRLVEALAEAPQRGWTIVNMKTDWAHVFADAPQGDAPEHTTQMRNREQPSTGLPKASDGR